MIYQINSNGWDYTVTNVEYQPEQPAVLKMDADLCDPPKPEDIQFKWTRKPDCLRDYDVEPKHSHVPENDKYFLAELIGMVTGE